MRLKAKIYRVSEVTEIPVDGIQDCNVVRSDILEMAVKFPGKLNFRKPEKNEKYVVEVEQIG